MSPYTPSVSASVHDNAATDIDDTASLKSASPTGTTASSGTKRKRVAEPKYYSVRVGHRPGIYYSWSECLRQVKGFKNATFKSFTTLTDAERFMAGEDPSNKGLSEVAGAGSKFYAVRSGRVPGIYTDWPSAQKQIVGWTKPKHKCFSTRVEAQRFLGEVDKGTSGESTEDSENQKSKKVIMAANGGGRSARSVAEEYNPELYEAGTGPLPPGAIDGFDPNILLDPRTGEVVYKKPTQKNATKLQAVAPSSDSMLRIHTDGSSLRNGKVGAMSGVGVYFGPMDERNISETLPGPRQTNQRAELTAIMRALDTVPKDRDVTIVTDSRYSIDCVTMWCGTWRKNGWKTSTGKSVENRDLVENILGKMEERTGLGAKTVFEWIKGHANHPGNVEADKLAVAGAMKARDRAS